MTAIFISHSSRDKAAAEEIKRWLEDQGHTSVFLDFDVERGIEAGADWEQTLYQRLRQCQAVIALLSPDWIGSRWCFAELVMARERGKAIFLVKVRPCDESGIFADIQHTDLTTEPEEGYERLKQGLLDRGLNPHDTFPWDHRRPPYPGFTFFDEDDAAIFFGRDDEIRKTLEALDALRRQGYEAPAFVLLFGASGSGKSSLVRAGVIPRLRKQPAQWLPLPAFRPKRDPLAELAMSLAAAFHQLERDRDWSMIHSDLNQAAAQQPADGQVLAHLARDLALAAGHPEATVLLTVDQAEELFSDTAAEPATRFLRLLRAGLETADHRLMAIATLRSDCLGKFQNHPMLQDSEYGHHFRYHDIPVDPMLERSFAQVIERPAHQADLELEPGLVQTMVADTGTRDALPLLAFTLHRLYSRFGGDNRLTIAEYEELGRLDGAIRNEAQRILVATDPTPEQREALHAAFVPTLVGMNADGEYVRRRAPLNILPEAAVPLLDHFVNVRLLVTDRDNEDRETFEIAHEALLRTWPQLAAWLSEDRDNLRLLDNLRRAAEEWERRDRRDDLLVHREARLEELTELVASPRFEPDGTTERQYLSACLAAQSAREALEKEDRDRRIRDAQEKQATAEANNRKLRTFSVIIAAVAVSAIVAASVAVIFQQQAQKNQKAATAQKLIAQAQGMLAGTTPGGDAQAFQQILAAYSLGRDNATDSAVYTAAAQRASTLKIIPGHTESVNGVAFSPNGHRLASASDDDTVRLWNPDTGQQIGRPLKGHTGPVRGVAFSQDGHRLASASDDATVRLWNPDTGQQIGRPLKGHTGPVWGVAFSQDGHLLATAGDDATVRLWNPDTDQQIGRPLKGHTSSVLGVAFSPNGHRLASASDDATVRLWNPDTGQQIGRPLKGHTGPVWGVAFSQDGHLLATAGDDATVRLWNPDTGQQIGDPLKGHTGEVRGVAFSPDGHRVTSAGADHTVRLWNTDTGQPLGDPLRGHTGPVWGVAFSPDGPRVATASADHTVRMWEADMGQPLGSPLPGEVPPVALSPDGHRVATAGADHTVRMWDADTGRPIGAPLTGHTGTVSSVVFSPDGHRVAAVGVDDTVRVWDADTGRPIGGPFTGNGWVRSVAFSPDGHRLASAGFDGMVWLWNPDTGQQIGGPLQGHTYPVSNVAFSPDGHRLASASWEGAIRLWNTDTGKPLGNQLTGHTGAVWSLAFSPNGHLLASASRDDTVRLWNIDTGQPLGDPLLGHTGPVLGVAFSPDGHRLASAGYDGTVRLWNTENRQPIGEPLTGHTGVVREVVFSPDGHRLVSVGSDYTVRLWPAEASPDTLCAKLTTNMSHQQWRDWVSTDIKYITACRDLPTP